MPVDEAKLERKFGETNLFSHQSLVEKPDETMSSILEETCKTINNMLQQGASEIKIAWKNIPETANPLRDKGFVRVTGIRPNKSGKKVTYARDN